MSLLSHLVGHLTLSLKGDCAVNAVLEDAAPRNRVLDSLTSLSFSQKPDFHIQMNVTFLRLSFFFLTSAFVLYLQSFSLRCRLHSKWRVQWEGSGGQDSRSCDRWQVPQSPTEWSVTLLVLHFKSSNYEGLPRPSSGLDSAVSLQRMWVWSLVRELRSHKPCSVVEKKKSHYEVPVGQALILLQMQNVKKPCALAYSSFIQWIFQINCHHLTLYQCLHWAGGPG